MDVVWVVIGVLLLLVTLLDAFLAVLNYDEAGLFVDRMVRGQWVLLRAITRRVSRPWRPLVLRQVTGILIVVTILWWVAGIVLGFTFIYLGAMGVTGAIQTSGDVRSDFLGALYLSLGQFATVGVDDVGPGTPVLGLLTVAEALVGVVLLSFIITFLGGVYGVIQSLQTLSANFFRAGRGISDPIDSLAPFFPDGRSRGLDDQLGSIVGALSDYGHGLAQNRAAYYFQSGRDQFALPFAIYMTTGVVGALRWGLPTGSDAAAEPALARLMEVWEDFRERLDAGLRWEAAPAPAPVSAQEFRDAVAAYDAGGSTAGLDAWVVRFLTVDRRMAALTRSNEAIDAEDAYGRYLGWLPFEHAAQALLTAVSRDLDYQPVFRRPSPAGGSALAAQGDRSELLPVEVARHPRQGGRTRRRSRGVGDWIARRTAFIDPGGVRLSSAGSTMAGVVVALGAAFALAQALGAHVLSSVVLSGLIALFASPAAIGAARGGAPWVGLLAVFPALAGVALGAVMPSDPVVTVVAIGLVAALAMWVRRFGGRARGLGQLGFVAYYFALTLDLEAAGLVGALVAAGVGLLCSWAAGLLPAPSRARRIEGAVTALHGRVAALLGAMIDVVSSPSPDRHAVRTVRRQQEALQAAASVISGYLDETDAGGPAASHALDLRITVFDVQLAADNLVALAPLSSGDAMSLDARARLNADLAGAQAHVASLGAARRADPASLPPVPAQPAPAEDGSARALPTALERMRAAVRELAAGVDGLDSSRAAAAHARGRDDSGAQAPVPGPGPGGRGRPDAEDAGREATAAEQLAAVSSRQAVQAGLSTSIALFLGSFVSTSHQYWAAMPAFSVLSGSDGETRVKAAQRVAVTVLGATIAFGLALLAGHSPAVAVPLLVVSVFFIAFLRPVSSVWATFWQTLLLATVYDVLGTLQVETVQVRVIETVIGSLVAVVISAAVLPTRTRARVSAAMTDVLRRAAALADAQLRPASVGTASPGGGTEGDLRDLGERLSALEDATAPLRGGAGALSPAGIWAQLNTLWSIAYYVRRLSRERDAALRGVPDGMLAELARATADNFAAAAAVLARTLPRRIQPADRIIDAGQPAEAPSSREYVTSAIRLNQAVLALIEARKPGTVVATTVERPAARALAADNARE